MQTSWTALPAKPTQISITFAVKTAHKKNNDTPRSKRKSTKSPSRDLHAESRLPRRPQQKCVGKWDKHTMHKLFAPEERHWNHRNDNTVRETNKMEQHRTANTFFSDTSETSEIGTQVATEARVVDVYSTVKGSHAGSPRTRVDGSCSAADSNLGDFIREVCPLQLKTSAPRFLRPKNRTPLT